MMLWIISQWVWDRNHFIALPQFAPYSVNGTLPREGASHEERGAVSVIKGKSRLSSALCPTFFWHLDPYIWSRLDYNMHN